MRITRNILIDLMREAFDCGQHGCHDLRTQCIEEIVWVFEKVQQQPWVVMSLKDLCGLPTGGKIHHSVFGDGTVQLKGGEKFVRFAGFRMELAEEGWPWTEKIQVIY